jgi:repressor LexA
MLEYIRHYIAGHGYPPTIREIGRALKISSTSVVNYNLNKLEQLGYLQRNSQVSRGLKLPSLGGATTVRVPVLGTIAAGEPIPVLDESAAHDLDDMLELTREIVSDDSGVYALHVKGTSMIDALINDGDIVVLRQEPRVDNGDMVAVWIKSREETTLKRFYHEGRRVRLQPANPDMGPIYADSDDIEVQGKVIAVIRSLN